MRIAVVIVKIRRFGGPLQPRTFNSVQGSWFLEGITIYAARPKVSCPANYPSDEDLWNFSPERGIIKIDRNVETVNSDGRHPRDAWNSLGSRDTARSRGPTMPGAKENSFVFLRGKKTRRIMPVKCIVPCKHIFEGEWTLLTVLARFISERCWDF